MKQIIEMNNLALLRLRQRYEASREHVIRDLYDEYGLKVSVEVLKSWEKLANPKSCVVLFALLKLYGCDIDEMFAVTEAEQSATVPPSGPF